MTGNFYQGKKVLVTGHTGFKGSWLCKILNGMGARVYGYSLMPDMKDNLYDIAGIEDTIDSETGDIRDYDNICRFLGDVRPEIVIHMAAQPLVRKSYEEPRATYDTNVMGTVNILESIRHCDSVRSFLNVTTDKVYENLETNKAYVETDPLNGYDPYSNSKSCSELVTSSYKNSFFKGKDCIISTARAGNVIGGGDFSKDRIIPDCVRAAISGGTIQIRNPMSVRPYQHVLEPLFAYLTIVEAQWGDQNLAGSYNVGPDITDCVTTGELATYFCESWGNGLSWKNLSEEGPHEAGYLRLDNTLIKEILGVIPRWNIRNAVEKTVEWTKAWNKGMDINECMDTQIREYIKDGYSKA